MVKENKDNQYHLNYFKREQLFNCGCYNGSCDRNCFLEQPSTVAEGHMPHPVCFGLIMKS